MSAAGYRATAAEVDLDAVRHNVGILRPPGAELMAIVKADGYGHGAVPVSRAALEAGATWLGVALVEEGLELRAAGIDAPTLVLSECPPGAEADLVSGRLTPTVYTDDGLLRLAEAAEGTRIGVHVKVDTGMHRVGIWPPEDAVAFLGRVVDRGLDVEGLWTHFARSEDDAAQTKCQVDRFAAVVEEARAAGLSPRYVHAANSGAVIRHPETCLDLVRPGIAIYGILPAPDVGTDLGLRPALRWRSRVSMVKRLGAGERVSYGQTYELPQAAGVAIVPVGYADGYPRAASSRAQVLIGGRRCTVAGNVTMDQLIVDCADLPVRAGDEVVLVGSQGDDEVTAWELAGHAGTIAYEILTGISARVPREYAG